MRFPLKVSFLSLSSSSSSLSGLLVRRHRHHHRSQRWQRKKTIRFVLLLVCVVYVFPTRNHPTLILTLRFDLNNDQMKNSFVLCSHWVLWSVVANEFEKDATREGIVICFCDVSLRVFHFIQNEKENFVTRRRTKNSHIWCRGAKKSIILFHAYTCGFDQTIKLSLLSSLSLVLRRVYYV